MQLFLCVIFLTSFAIRRIGLKFGFPLLTHPDEVFSIEPVYYMTLNKSLNSDTFNRPDQILLLINFFYLNIISYIKFGKSLAQTYLDNLFLFYFYARLLVSFFGSIIPIVAFKIGKEFKNDFSISAALIFALFPSFVIHSHFATPDILITLITLIIIFFTIRFVKTENQNNIYIATFFSALNTAEKYPGLISLCIIFMGVVIFINDKGMIYLRCNLKNLLIFCSKLIGIFLLSLYLAAPNLFINFGKVIDSITFEARSTHLGADNLGFFGNMVFYVENYYSFIGFIGGFFVLIGVVYLSKKGEKTSFLLFYGFVYWIMMSILPLHWERWALPMYITPNFLIAIGINNIIIIFKNNRIEKYLSLLVVFIFIVYQLIYSLSLSIQFSFQDTRVVSQVYCGDNGIVKENSLFEGYTPLNPQFPDLIFNYEIETKDENKYVILSSYIYQRYFEEPGRYEKEINFYNKIKNSYKIVYEIEPTHVNSSNVQVAFDNIRYYLKLKLGDKPEIRLNGPTIQIYEITN